MNWVLISAGGAVGSVCRYLLSGWVAARVGAATFPVGTLAVNLLGSLVIGFLAGMWLNQPAPAAWRLLAVTGFLGGFTTFSAFSLELLVLMQQQQWVLAAAYAGGSVVCGLALALAGFWLGQQL